jgi:fatty-acyl-CoA synthase
VHAWTDALACDGAAARAAVGPRDLAVLPYTSGTTGLPKGCMHTHGSIMHNAVASSLWGNGSAENVTLMVVPMFHITGMVSVMHTAASTAAHAGHDAALGPRTGRAADLALQGDQLDQHPHHGDRPAGQPQLRPATTCPAWRYIGGGGAAMPQAVAQRLLDQYGLRYVEGYGLTETAAPSHTNPPDAPKQQCLGIPFMSTDARVVDPETLQELPQGEQGEIIITARMVFQGYWKRPDATAAAFIEHDGKRFFRSGDLGRVDEDGYFFITDRSSA